MPSGRKTINPTSSRTKMVQPLALVAKSIARQVIPSEFGPDRVVFIFLRTFRQLSCRALVLAFECDGCPPPTRRPTPGRETERPSGHVAPSRSRDRAGDACGRV